MIDQLLPETVVAVEAFADTAGATLFPEENDVVAAVIDPRRREFTTVRTCARQGLAQLGFAPAPILPGDQGAPSWPDGAVGSMTHCTGYRAAAVGFAHDHVAIGIDAEPHGPLPAGVLGAIAVPEEQAWVARLRAVRPDTHWDRLLFSAKESVYKAWFPMTHQWLGFRQATISVDVSSRTFSAAIAAPSCPSTIAFSGSWLVAGDLVLTAVSVPASRR
jgi:4'-phosphopantetheinyl transferase EntD